MVWAGHDVRSSGRQTVPAEALDEFEQRYTCPLAQLYGMTETIGTPLINPIYGVRRNMTIGLPALGYEVREHVPTSHATHVVLARRG